MLGGKAFVEEVSAQIKLHIGSLSGGDVAVMRPWCTLFIAKY